METNTEVQHQVFVESPMDMSGAASAIDAQINAADAVCSENNITKWASYLPDDCIKAMIAMGWDVST